ncbi:MAG: hypothetical protein ACR2IK_11480 [Chloroflexota bacterium]
MPRLAWAKTSSVLPVLAAALMASGCTAAAPTAAPPTAPPVAAKPTTAAPASPATAASASAVASVAPVTKPAASPSAAAAASVVPSPSAIPAAAAAAAPVSLKGVCPDNVVVQTNWWPEADHGLLYQLIGPNGKIDPNTNAYSGPLGTTGVNLEVRAGGPAIGFQTVTAQEYQDDDILLGLGSTDEQIGTSADQPTVAVLAWYDKNPQILFWGNPAWNFTSVADIKASGATVLAFSAAAFLDVLQGKGSLDKNQVDTSYTGDPSRFVAADGSIVSQGFVTAEPYIYENEVNGWKKPIKFLLLDKEVPIYQDTLVIRADKLPANRACLQKLVPLMQRSAIDYVKNPGPINAMLVDYTAKIKGGTQISEPGAADAVQKMLSQGIVANGTDGVYGSYDTARVQTLITDFGPIFAARGKAPKSGLQPSDLFTNEFLDKSIKL